MSGTTQTKINATNSLVAGYIPTTASAAAYFDSAGALTSNSAPIRSNSGSIAATTIPQTIFTLTTGGSYYLYAVVNNSGTDYRTVVLITTDGVTADITNLKAGVQMLITLSGLNIQLALGVGTGAAVWGLIRVF
jgi:hypothetical protein